MKYYWLVYSYNNAGGGKTLQEDVTKEIHPFKYMADERGDKGRLAVYNITLINWKQISKEEFLLFKSL